MFGVFANRKEQQQKKNEKLIVYMPTGAPIQNNLNRNAVW